MIDDQIKPVLCDNLKVGDSTRQLDKTGALLLLWCLFWLYVWWTVL